MMKTMNLKDISSPHKFKNEFQILKKIGQGGFSRVYEANSKIDMKTYAIKQIIIT